MTRLVHRLTGPGEVRCGRHMRHPAAPVTFAEIVSNAAGWDLGTASADPRAVTCPACRMGVSPSPESAVAIAEGLFEAALAACESPLCGEDETVVAEDARLALVACYDQAGTPESDRRVDA